MSQTITFGVYRIYIHCHQGCKHHVIYTTDTGGEGTYEVEELWTKEKILEKIPEVTRWNHFKDPSKRPICHKIADWCSVM